MLQTHDRVEPTRSSCGAEFLAQMLGEPTAGSGDGGLRRRALIAYDGDELLEVRDRAALERASCECYGDRARRVRAAARAGHGRLSPSPVPSLRAPSQAPRGRDRRQDALALQPGQDPLPARGVHQGPGDRLRRQDLRHARGRARRDGAREARRGRRHRRDARALRDRRAAARVSSCLPRRKLHYRGVDVEEFDLDAALEAPPAAAAGRRAGAHQRARARGTPSAGRTSRSCSTPASTCSRP